MNRLQIAFDIDTKVCRKILGKNYNKVYKDIRVFMENKGFEHRQGSVYHSIEPMMRAKATETIDSLIEEMPYLTKCIRDITQTRIGDDVSLNDLFEYDGTPGKYINYYKKNNQKTL